MTRWLLEALASLRGSVTTQVLTGSVVLMILPFTLLGDMVLAWHKSWRIRRVLGEDETHCPAGHVVELVGAFECPACKFRWEGHAFEPCPACGAMAHGQCACGLTLPNVLVER